MKTSYITALLFAAVANASPVLDSRQSANKDTQAVKTILVTNVDWQRSGSTINGIRFQATVFNNANHSWRCTSDSSGSGEPFAPLKIDRCARGSPLTFAYDTSNGHRVHMWYTNDAKSYAGSVAVTPGNNANFQLDVVEVEPTPTQTPVFDPALEN